MVYPIGDTLKAAWAELWQNRLAFVKFAALPVLLQIAGLVAQELTGRNFNYLGAFLALIVLVQLLWVRHLMQVSPVLPREGKVLGLVFWGALKSAVVQIAPLFLSAIAVDRAHAAGFGGGLVQVLGLLLIGGSTIWLVHAHVRLATYVTGLALQRSLTLREAFGETRAHAAGIFWLLMAACALFLVIGIVVLALPAAIVPESAAPLVLGSWAVLCSWAAIGFTLSLNLQIYRQIKAGAE